MNGVTLCIPTLIRYDLLVVAIDSARRNSVPPARIVVMDNGGSCPDLPDVEILRPGRNLGCAGSWNFFLDLGNDPLVIANDDVRFHENTIAELVGAARAQPDQVFFCPRGRAGEAFSLFLLRQSALEKVGRFDECFWPAYFEDNSYAYRLRLAGQRENHADCSYDHEHSRTLAAYDAARLAAHHEQFRLNLHCYQAMWGGPVGAERFTIPFDGDEERRRQMMRHLSQARRRWGWEG